MASTSTSWEAMVEVYKGKSDDCVAGLPACLLKRLIGGIGEGIKASACNVRPS